MADPPPLIDGYSSYAGGCHAAAHNPRELAENQLSHIVNGTVRGSFLTPRDGFSQATLRFKNAEDRRVFETGRFQGETYYGETESIVCVIDGRVFSIHPPSGQVSRHSAGGKKQPLSADEDFAWLKERDGYVVCGDGINRAVILNKHTARRANPNAQEVFAGTVMADGWGRLMLANYHRNRLYFSDHELDPNSESWKFTEQNDYYLAARYFQPARRLGKIMAAEFIPYVDAPAGFGPLLVLGERASVTYDVSVPRVDGGWVKTNIERMTLLNIGTCGHRTVMAVDNDVIFRDQHGRLRTLSQTVREQDERKNSQRIRRFDREVSPWIKRETPWLRRWADVASFDDRYLFTALPEATTLPDGRRDVWHRGILAYNLDVLANLRGEEEPAWDGLLTGLRAQAITGGLFGGEPKLFIFSRDSDGVRRLYEQRPGLTYDLGWSTSRRRVVRKAIEWQAGTRWFDFKSPFIAKRLSAALIRFGDIRGAITIEAFARKAEGAEFLPWFTHHDVAADALSFGFSDCGDCGIREAEPGDCERLPLPALPVPIESFFRLQIMLRITGWCELREMTLEATLEGSAPLNTAATYLKPAARPATLAHQWNDITYDIVTAPEDK